jgi:hypothetical protein
MCAYCVTEPGVDQMSLQNKEGCQEGKNMWFFD